jgi:hypothetical protein
MKNIRETLSNALAIGGLVTTVGSAVDAVRTNSSSRETQQRQSITEEIRNEFHVRQDCGFVGVPGSGVCSDHIDGIFDSGEEELVLEKFRNELSAKLRQIPPDQGARRRFAGDCVGMIAGEVIALSAIGRKKETDITSE